MKPFDPRLLRYAKSVRRVLGVGAALGVLRTVAIIVWCWCIANALATLIAPWLRGEKYGLVLTGMYPRDDIGFLLLCGFAALVTRSLCTWLLETVSSRGAIAAKAQLRSTALNRLDTSYPAADSNGGSTRLATTLGRGLDALDGYFANYLPQLLLTACATPVLVLIVLWADWVSGLIVIIVFPIIPVFMILIGLATQRVQNRQWEQLNQLSSAFLDTVSGLGTLKIFGREQRQQERIRKISDDYRRRTMQVLRVTFLSGFVLDLAGTFSVALVAVTVGTRLVYGDFPLALGLFVLLLLPEVFIPIRQVGVAFHASAEGLEAAGAVFKVIEGKELRALPEAGAADGAGSNGAGAGAGAAGFAGREPGIVVSDLTVTHGSTQEAGSSITVGPHSFTVRPGEFVVMAGPSGSGKSTVVGALLGFVPLSGGEAAANGGVSWCGQKPGLMQGTIAENLSLGHTGYDQRLGSEVLARVGLSTLNAAQLLGASGSGVSGGQAQRLAIARCLYNARVTGSDCLILDEPTSALDHTNEARICRLFQELAREGKAVLVVSHRPQVIAAADRTVKIAAGEESREERPDSDAVGERLAEGAEGLAAGAARIAGRE